MAGRGRNNSRGRGDNSDDDDNLLGGLVAAAAVAGLGYAAYKFLSSGSESQETGSRQRQSPLECRGQSVSCSSGQLHRGSLTRNAENKIIIGVDATPTRGGGLLLLPKWNTVYFYSIDWSDRYKFPGESDKFELVNTLLALAIFKGSVSKYRNSNPRDELVLKTDNNFCQNPGTVYSGTKNAKWRKLFQETNSILEASPYNGSWNYTSSNDKYISMANKLSRRSFQELPPRVGTLENFLVDVNEENLSNRKKSALDAIVLIVPDEVQTENENACNYNDVDGITEHNQPGCNTQ